MRRNCLLGCTRPIQTLLHLIPGMYHTQASADKLEMDLDSLQTPGPLICLSSSWRGWWIHVIAVLHNIAAVHMLPRKLYWPGRCRTEWYLRVTS